MDYKTISRSREDYLKAVYITIKKYGACKNVDVSNQLGVSKSSACIAIKKLEQDGFIKKYDWRIQLTEQGFELAEKLHEKDMFFLKWFKEIGVSEKTAEIDAHMIEHAISEETYNKIKGYINTNC